MSKKHKKEEGSGLAHVPSEIDADDHIAEIYRRRLTKSNVRKVAQQELDDAMMRVIRTFNLADVQGVPWTFPSQTRKRAQELMLEIAALFHESEIRPRPHAIAQSDSEFQRFLGKLTG